METVVAGNASQAARIHRRQRTTITRSMIAAGVLRTAAAWAGLTRLHRPTTMETVVAGTRTAAAKAGLTHQHQPTTIVDGGGGSKPAAAGTPARLGPPDQPTTNLGRAGGR